MRRAPGSVSVPRKSTNGGLSLSAVAAGEDSGDALTPRSSDLNGFNSSQTASFLLSSDFWKRTAIDYILLLALFVLLTLTERNTRPFIRPVELSDPAYSSPHLQDIAPVKYILLVGFLLPPVLSGIIFIDGANTLIVSLRQAAQFCLCGYESFAMTLLVTVVLKVVAGRPRPYFIQECGAYDTTTGACTGDSKRIMEARRSFPSGHSSLAFSIACFTFLALIDYFEGSFRRRKAVSGTPIYLLRYILLVLPWFFASLIGISRTRDNHHHWSDIVAGAGLGVLIAWIGYRNRCELFRDPSQETETSAYLDGLESGLEN